MHASHRGAPACSQRDELRASGARWCGSARLNLDRVRQLASAGTALRRSAAREGTDEAVKLRPDSGCRHCPRSASLPQPQRGRCATLGGRPSRPASCPLHGRRPLRVRELGLDVGGGLPGDPLGQGEEGRLVQGHRVACLLVNLGGNTQKIGSTRWRLACRHHADELTTSDDLHHERGRHPQASASPSRAGLTRSGALSGARYSLGGPLPVTPTDL